jgi:hypothetical protein
VLEINLADGCLSRDDEQNKMYPLCEQTRAGSWRRGRGSEFLWHDACLLILFVAPVHEEKARVIDATMMSIDDDTPHGDEGEKTRR